MSEDPGSGAMTIEEMEQEINAPVEEAPPKQTLGEIILDGDDVPEAARGKSAKDLANYATRLEEALRLSESARVSATSAPAAPPLPAPEPELTREQLAELYQQDPLAAIEAIETRAGKRIYEHLERRLAPLAQSTASSAETMARQKYGMEFEMFGPQIQEFVRSLPDKTVLSSERGWEDLISYVRGKPENFDRYINARVANDKGSSARAEEINSTGFSPRASTRSPAPASPGSSAMDNDPLAREIADKLGMDWNEYKKWARVS